MLYVTKLARLFSEFDFNKSMNVQKAYLKRQNSILFCLIIREYTFKGFNYVDTHFKRKVQYLSVFIGVSL